MFYWLIELSNTFPPWLGALRTGLNVFRYITFRTGGAVVTGALFVFLFGPWIIDHLRVRQGKGQPIRADGPELHVIEKVGTPTMGGVLILTASLGATLAWVDLRDRYIWAVLLVNWLSRTYVMSNWRRPRTFRMATEIIAQKNARHQTLLLSVQMLTLCFTLSRWDALTRLVTFSPRMGSTVRTGANPWH